MDGWMAGWVGGWLLSWLSDWLAGTEGMQHVKFSSTNAGAAAAASDMKANELF